MVTLVTFSLRRNLQMEEGQVSNLLNEETHAGLGWLPQCSYWGETCSWRRVRWEACWLRRHLQGRDGYLGNLLTEEKLADWGITCRVGMVTLVTFSLRRNLLTEETPAG
jgi:hypothetical protein